MQKDEGELTYIHSDVPIRLDRLPWATWHTTLVISLGIGWVLDALETTYNSMTLRTLGEVFGVGDLALTCINLMWMLGALCGAICFGALSDRYGRRWVYLVTICAYTLGTVINASIPKLWAMLLLRFVSGFGIGGENSTVHTIIQEFIPARHRGKVNMLICSTWDLGSTLTSLLASVCVSHMTQALSWRVGMFVGAGMGVLVLAHRYFFLPESPRWLLSMNRIQEAEGIMRSIEQKCGDSGWQCGQHESLERVQLVARTDPTSLMDSLKSLVTDYKVPLMYSAGLNAALNFDSYGFPAVAQLGIFPSCGISESMTSIVYLAATGVTIIVNPVYGWLLDKIGRKILIPVLYALTLIATTGFYGAGRVCQLNALFAVTIVWRMFECPAANCAIAAGTEVFPTRLASVGNGVSHATGRLFAGISQICLVAVFQNIGLDAAISMLMCAYVSALAICVMWCFLGIEGAAQSLEALSSPDSCSRDCEEELELETVAHKE
eukprot:Blabericola_migrator_1__2287@NODE_1632_length_4136_cov_31_937577_g1063_i0_p2_GENE_NODE_1632_length_4136_cov_31_937577_g1063_i0NODE_1632_length_4136_cov_31_937577_g1063_i0_p2_ORF_typecomplete_len493_score101_05Sugar_tr/PF00083_24/2_1e59MFS_1/PF07690_16/8_7e30MFS_1/PF07690_16/2_6e06MFS_3/PF05977_13/1_2e15MFS_3/PF05977_13/2_1TRI12/PF06609_13/1_8e14TRI12/PF06609_13/4_7e03MFS_4/PF06779_14/1_4e10MFS_4/PF06779_14/19MFS_4/PF06779_14/2_5e02MFS_2/PF13347_6/5_8e07MFS_2/PF13347_6/0_0011MFS_2/PF13347_6/0_041